MLPNSVSYCRAKPFDVSTADGDADAMHFGADAAAMPTPSPTAGTASPAALPLHNIPAAVFVESADHDAVDEVANLAGDGDQSLASMSVFGSFGGPKKRADLVS